MTEPKTESKTEKSKLVDDLERMAPDQFKVVTAAVEAERTRRDGAKPPNFGSMSEWELARWKDENFK